MASSTIIPVPANERDFEENCVPLFAGHLNDPNVKTVGSRGHAQQGLDLIGARDRDPNQPAGVQCKLRTKGDKLTPAQVREEVEKALKVEPKLTEYYIVTTAADDPAMDALAMTIRQEQSKLGRKIDIQIWGWETTQRHIRQYRKAMDAFDPGQSAATDALLEMGEETNRELKGHTAILLEIQASMGARPSDPARGSALEAHLDDQVDQYRDLINAGRSQTALELLVKLEARLDASASAAIRARVRANIGWCHIRLGEDVLGGRLLLEAYDINPADPKVIGNRVLGMVLTGDVAGAARFGREALTADPTNAHVAAFVYHAAVVDAELPDPEEFVPAALKGEVGVMVQRTSYHRARGETETWRRLAAETFKKHPGDDGAARYAAEALIDEALAAGAFDRNPTPSAKQERQLQKGAAILAPLWEKARKTESPGQDYLLTLGVNLANAYRALAREDEARIVVDQLLAISPDHPDAVATALFMALQADDVPTAVTLARRLPEGPTRSVHLLSALARQDDWAGVVAEATPERRLALDPGGRQAFDTLLFQARVNAKLESDLDAAADALVAAWPRSIATLVVVAGALRASPEKADALVETAKGLLGPETLYGERLMLARLLDFRRDYEGVIACLDGYVSTKRPSQWLTALAVAFVNAPPRPRTHRFFESLSREVIEDADYARLAGVAEANRGDLERAERHLRVAVGKDDTDLRAHLQLHSVLRRRRLDEVARTRLIAVDEARQVGSPADFMRLAHLLSQVGEFERALALGYDVARRNGRDESVAASYPPLVLTGGDLPAAVRLEGPAAEDFWFDLEGSGIEDIQGVIEASNADDAYGPDHPLAKAVIGKSVGDEVVLARELGPDRTYRVRGVAHKYLWLMRDIMRRHATAFPESNNLIALDVADGDVQPILDMVKQLGEPWRRVEQFYAANPIPLSIIATLSGKSVIEFADHLANSGARIRACTGDLPERALAMRQVRAAKGRGAVLDMLTVWVARQLGLLESLKAYFGRLVVPRSTIDTLLEIRAKREFHRGEDLMTIGYQGEQAVRDIQPPEATEAVLTLIDATITDIETHCEVLPNDGGDDLSLDADTISRLAEGDVLDPLHLVRREKLLFLSDDLHLRQWAREYGAVRGAWLQVAVWSLLQAGLIGEVDYALAIGQLGARRHGHLWLDVDALKAIRRIEDPHRRDANFEVVLAFIGGPDADMGSHVGVVADFMQEVERGNVEGANPGRAVDRLLTRLLANAPDWRSAFVLLVKALRGRTSLLDLSAARALGYLNDWIKGHFLVEAFIAGRSAPDPSPRRNRRRRGK